MCCIAFDFPVPTASPFKAPLLIHSYAAPVLPSVTTQMRFRVLRRLNHVLGGRLSPESSSNSMEEIPRLPVPPLSRFSACRGSGGLPFRSASLGPLFFGVLLPMVPFFYLSSKVKIVVFSFAHLQKATFFFYVWCACLFLNAPFSSSCFSQCSLRLPFGTPYFCFLSFDSQSGLLPMS